MLTQSMIFVTTLYHCVSWQVFFDVIDRTIYMTNNESAIGFALATIA